MSWWSARKRQSAALISSRIWPEESVLPSSTKTCSQAPTVPPSKAVATRVVSSRRLLSSLCTGLQMLTMGLGGLADSLGDDISKDRATLFFAYDNEVIAVLDSHFRSGGQI